jgi:hypothetical protein
VTDAKLEDTSIVDDYVVDDSTTEGAAHDHAVQYGVGPFSIREVALAGVWVVAFVVSFFSISVVGFNSVWTSGIAWILTIGLPTVAVFLIVLRRLSPTGIRRVGSLGIDQFASVAFSVSSIVWLQMVWETVAFAASTGQWVRTWVIWVSLFLMVVGVFLTVFAPFIAPFDEDFVARDEIPAHRNARPIRPVTARPAPVAPAPVAEEPTADADLAGEITEDTEAAATADSAPEGDAIAGESSIDETRALPLSDGAIVEEPAADPAEAEVAEAEASASADDSARPQAFWALVPEERDVVDELGLPMFRIGPTAWALVIEDRGTSFIVRHEDGRTGTLNDVSGVTRG